MHNMRYNWLPTDPISEMKKLYEEIVRNAEVRQKGDDRETTRATRATQQDREKRKEATSDARVVQRHISQEHSGV